jgi:predicted ArsR family transcriptional regulator
VRLHLERLRAAGLVERVTVSGGRGRPRHEWALTPDPVPGRPAPTAYRDLARWLVRGLGADAGALDRVAAAGRAIGRAASPVAPEQPPADALRTALTSLGFQPAREDEPGRTRYVLRNCPYRDAVTESPAVVCGLHEGITRGLLDELAPEAELTGFVPREPHAAGCLVEVEWGPAG